METATAESKIISKTVELCETVVGDPSFKSIKKRVDTFMADEEAKNLYQKVSEQGEYLQHKQQQGVSLADEEIAAFEKERDTLFANENARGFLDAQDEMHQIQTTISKYVSKTLELGRVPESQDLESGSCGSGCGCH